MPKQKQLLFEACPDYPFASRTLKNFHTEAQIKFAKGQQEHGGSIMHKPLLGEMRNEVIDQMFYVSAIKEKVECIKSELSTLIRAINLKSISRIDAILALSEINTKLENL